MLAFPAARFLQRVSGRPRPGYPVRRAVTHACSMQHDYIGDISAPISFYAPRPVCGIETARPGVRANVCARCQVRGQLQREAGMGAHGKLGGREQREGGERGGIKWPCPCGPSRVHERARTVSSGL